MHSIHQLMSHDHKRCDDLFVAAQQLAARQLWPETRHHTDQFVRNMLQHFHHEETVLFPAFEQASGMQHGPSVIMRDEHDTLRGLFDDLCQAVTLENSKRYLGVAESLFFFMQQHNMKEENMLYPMMDQTFNTNELSRLCRLMEFSCNAA